MFTSSLPLVLLHQSPISDVTICMFTQHWYCTRACDWYSMTCTHNMVTVSTRATLIMLTSMYFSCNNIIFFLLLLLFLLFINGEFINGTWFYYTERCTDGYPTLSPTGPTCLTVALVTPHVAPLPPAVAQVKMFVEFSLQIAPYLSRQNCRHFAMTT